MTKKQRTLALIIFLLGIFIGAMDSGIVSPARTVIAEGFKISANLSVWMVTIYTLAYAVSMPITAKFSDRFGKKKIYTISIVLFGIGSALCGLSNFYGNYNFLLISRVVQALGAGGIIPIATAFIGESFPLEKRGTALGLVGAVYGIATTLGPTIGSAVLDIAGVQHWGFIFFINLPICLLVVIISLFIKEEAVNTKPGRMDVGGSIVLSALILSLMYALTNLKFHEFNSSIQGTNVWPFLLIFVLGLPLFILIEKKAEDPVLNLKYFTDKNIAITLFISFVVGCGLMGIVFVPQFGENVLKLKTGSGGYLVTLMAVFSGVAAPIGGKLIDKFSAKLILLLGFSFTIAGTLSMALYTANHPGFIPLVIGLALMGLGMGFTMGTPLNYLMQSYVSKGETTTAQSTLSLMRSIGVAISPNLLVGFISDAGKAIQPKLMEIVPLPAQASGAMSGGSMPVDLLAKLQNSDVTTIVNNFKEVASQVITKMAPVIKQNMMSSISAMPKGKATAMNPDMLISNMRDQYIGSIEAGRAQIEAMFQSTLNGGFAKLFIAAAVIAVLGIILTTFLSSKKSKSLEIN